MRKIWLGLFAIFQLQSSDIREENVFLLSYPSSGNTWMRYCIEFITKRPTGEAPYLFPMQKENCYMNCPLTNNFSLGVDYDAHPVIKIHDISERLSQGDNDYLLVLVRDYKEAFLRNQEHDDFKESLALLKNPENRYLRALRAYRQWPEDRKILLYYEDLIQFPEETFHQLADFFQVDHEIISLFLQDFDFHRNNAITIYERDQSNSFSKGKDVHYHGKFLTIEQKKEFDFVCEEMEPELFNSYLIRYKEK